MWVGTSLTIYCNVKSAWISPMRVLIPKICKNGKDTSMIKDISRRRVVLFSAEVREVIIAV